ncbi:hypothetical protein FOA52_001368 [Chlamydomonas sp. UWO 241]|nr:hypothetical protein FOA52_001368 [Chlamydomonas sp. UWO 241]
MLVAPPHPGAFPHLQSLRLHLGAASIGSPADYEAIASAAPWLTHFSLELPASASALPQEMARLLAACSKLEDLEMSAYDDLRKWRVVLESSLANIDVLAAGTQILRLQLPICSRLTSLAPRRAMVNLQSLDMRDCSSVSDLAPLGGMVCLI